MCNSTLDLVNDLEKYRDKFPFPFISKNEKEDFLAVYKQKIEEIQRFSEVQFNWFQSNEGKVKLTFKKVYDLTYKVIQSKLKDDDKTAIEHLEDLMKIIEFDKLSHLDQKDFFRIRKTQWNNGLLKELKKEDMFHINYQDRRKCKNYRFSISGIPALYLGESLALCEKEIFYGCDPSDYYISQFRSRDNFKVITIDLPEWIIWRLVKGEFGKREFINFFAYLPFSAACIFRTAPPHNHSFNPEYIIPQMLMSYLKKDKLKKDEKPIGVRYPSTKFKYDRSTKPALNYAFPVTDPDKDGFCKNLKRIFGWTDPILSEINYDKMKTELREKAIKIEMSDDLNKLREGFGKAIE